MKEFIAIIHKEKNSDYGVCFPDFPGCITAGNTLEEAYEMAREALQSHIDVCASYGDSLPSIPLSLDEVSKHKLAKHAKAFMNVSVRMPGKTRRINISLDENIIRHIDNVADNRSAFLAQAALEKLEQQPSSS